ncbi:MAG: VWA domain-containing protein [Sulfolobales archaeon]
MPGVLLNIRYEDPLVRYRGEKILDIVRRFVKTPQDFTTNLAIDMFYTLYLPHPLLKNENDIERSHVKHYQIIKNISEDPEIKSVREFTLLNSSRSTIMAASIIESIIRELSRSVSEEREGKEGEDNSGSDESRGEDSISRAVKNAIKKAVSESKLLSRLEQILLGNQAGVGSVLDFDESGEEIIRLSRSIDISKLLEILENLPEMRAGSKRRKIRSSKGEIEGYEEGSDIERIVPSELAYPIEYIYAKITEGRLLIYEKKLTLSTGPIYVLMDKSGSMDGDKIKWAKATALALLMRARRERRIFAMRFFDTTPYSMIKVSRRARLSEIIRLIDYLSRIRSGGGTDITRAILTAVQDIRGMGQKAPNEIILVTDGEDKIAENIVSKQLKSVEAKLISVMILGDNPDLRRLSSKYFKVAKLSGSEIIRIVEYERES